MKKTMILGLIAITASFSASAQNKKTDAKEMKTDKSHELQLNDSKGWHKIGNATADFSKERQEVIVMGADRFASLKFKVKDAPLDLLSLEVFYESGDNQNITLGTPIQKNGESRVIDLNGGERDLKKIVFVYKTLPNSTDKKAEVEIWGLKTNVKNAGM
jgi:hypothetical protein